MYGTVTRYYKDRGYGFIFGEDGNTYFIHKSKLYGEEIDRGDYVYFKTFQNDDLAECDWLFKRGVKPIGCGRHDKTGNPYIVFLVNKRYKELESLYRQDL